jgi:hypothetical protein
MQAQKEVRQTGIAGQIFRVLFFGYNIICALWLISYWSTIGRMMETFSAPERTGATIGGTIGTLALFIFWACGAGILGLLVLVTRGPLILVPIEPRESLARKSLSPFAIGAFILAFLFMWVALNGPPTSSPTPPIAEQSASTKAAPQSIVPPRVEPSKPERVQAAPAGESPLTMVVTRAERAGNYTSLLFSVENKTNQRFESTQWSCVFLSAGQPMHEERSSITDVPPRGKAIQRIIQGYGGPFDRIECRFLGTRPPIQRN